MLLISFFAYNFFEKNIKIISQIYNNYYKKIDLERNAKTKYNKKAYSIFVIAESYIYSQKKKRNRKQLDLWCYYIEKLQPYKND